MREVFWFGLVWLKREARTVGKPVRWNLEVELMMGWDEDQV